MTIQPTITADETRVPLASLTLSAMNPRQHVPEAEVVELAESILAAGLIQNLAGIESANGGTEIVAGGRRLRALQYLAEQHPDLATERPELMNPPVRIAPDATTAQAWAIAENAARRDLHPADEIRAYGRMERERRDPRRDRPRLRRVGKARLSPPRNWRAFRPRSSTRLPPTRSA